MNKIKNLNIGGVPEHFNYPWNLAIEEKKFEKEGLKLHWTDYPEGTGAMCQDLRNGKLDAAVLLTEGIIKDISQGNPCKIVKIFVESPLIWGIHTSTKFKYHDISELKGKKYAISRLGSGSHLMAYVDADKRSWKLSEEQMVLVDNLQGAAQKLSEGKADVFVWDSL